MMQREETRRRYRRRAVFGILVALFAIAIATAIPILYPSTVGFFSSLNSPGVYVLLMAAYTVIPVVRHHHEPLIFWPAVMLLLGGPLILFALPKAGDPAFLSAVDPPFILAAILVMLASLVMLFTAFFATYGKEPIDFIHPLLLAAMQGTQASSDRPAPVEVTLGSGGFPDPAQFALFLRKRNLVATAHARHGRLTVRIGRVHGLPRFWSILLLPFGQTVLHVDPSGKVRIVVDLHVYRILDRPGPYTMYCRSVAEAFSRMATLVSRGDFDRALKLETFEASS